MQNLTDVQWNIIEEDAIYGTIDNNGKKIYLTLKELSNKHNVGYDYLRQRASKGKWLSKRKGYSSKVSQKVQEKKSEYDAETIVQSDDKFEDAGENIRRVALKKLSQIESDLDKDKFVRAIDIVNVASAIRTAQEIVKTAQGEVIDNVNHTGIEDLANAIKNSQPIQS